MTAPDRASVEALLDRADACLRIMDEDYETMLEPKVHYGLISELAAALRHQEQSTYTQPNSQGVAQMRIKIVAYITIPGKTNIDTFGEALKATVERFNGQVTKVQAPALAGSLERAYEQGAESPRDHG